MQFPLKLLQKHFNKNKFVACFKHNIVTLFLLPQLN